MLGEREMQQAVILELLNRRFDAVEAGIDRVDGRIDVLAEQVRVANGRTTKNELAWAGIQPHVDTLRREMRDAKGDISELKKPKNDEGENRTIKAWHIYYGVACIGLTIAVLKFFGRL